MRNSLETNAKDDLPSEFTTDRVVAREVVIPHDPKAGPVTAVRNVLIQSSLENLKACGHFDRYVSLISPSVLADLTAQIGPGWIPIARADAHYEACEDLMLDGSELARMGALVGDRLQETALVSPAKKSRDANFDLWSALLALHRIWPRLYQGGSVQIVKIGPREKLIEMRGFLLARHHYYRQANLTAVAAHYTALGQRASVKVAAYSPKTHEMVVRVTW